MTKHLIYILIIILMGACEEKQISKEPNVNFHKIELDFMKWWTYHNNNISLSSNFIAIDEASKKINKQTFLKTLASGNYIPLKLNSTDKLTYYQLFKLDETADKNIRTTIKNQSSVIYQQFQLEGTKFPDFNFIDLKGKEYNNNTTKGKIVVLKCWFINCIACVAEFPELNELVEKYQNNNDIEFISLAFDSKEELKQFILKKPFKYAVIPQQKGFMEKTLRIQLYPTHFIINRNGIIEKIVNKSSELINEIDKFLYISDQAN